MKRPRASARSARDAFRLGRSHRLSHLEWPRLFDSPSRSAGRRAERIDEAADTQPGFRGQGWQTWLFPPMAPRPVLTGGVERIDLLLRRDFFLFSHLSEESLIKGVIEVGARCNQIVKNRFCFRYDPTVLCFFNNS